MGTRRLAPLLAAIAVGVLAVATAATQAAARDAGSIETTSDDPAQLAAALVMLETRLLTEVGAFVEPLPPSVERLRDRWDLDADVIVDPLRELAAVEGMAVGMAFDLEDAGTPVPDPLARVLDALDDETWDALTAGRVGVLTGDDHEVALVLVVDLMGRTLDEAIDEVVGADDPPAAPVPLWLTGAAVVFLGFGLVLGVRLTRDRRPAPVADWLRELSVPVDVAAVERTVLELARDVVDDAEVRLVRPDDDDPVVRSATALGSATRRRGRLAIPAVGGGRIRRVLVVEPAPSRRADDIHELASLVGPAIARAEDHQSLADRDALTDVFNRRRLDRDLDDLDDLPKDDALGTSLLMIDVDHFKDWNDRHGHLAGDDALRQVADTLRSAVRPGDVVYRYGGEEFTVLLPRTSAADATTIAERLREAVGSTPILVDGEELGAVTVSVGLADTGEGDVSTLTERADAALYEAKRSGRDRVVIASAG